LPPETQEQDRPTIVPRERRSLTTVDKCVRILTVLADAPAALDVSEIVANAGLPRSTAYRHIAALRSHGLVESDPELDGYRLGTRILDLAASMDRKSLHDLALPHMESISRRTGETVVLCGLRANTGVCLEKVEGHHALRVSYELGDTYPLHAAATGKAIFAYLSAEERKRVIDSIGLPRRTDTTITNAAALLTELETIRAQGYAESRGESISGTIGIAAPIFGRSGHVAASIGISAPEHRAEGPRHAAMIELLLHAAATLTQELGGPARDETIRPPC